MFNNEADPRLASLLDKAPVAVWFACGQDLGKYVKQVRARDATRDHKTFVFITVNAVEEAERASNERKADVLVAEGAEAGGRKSIYSPPTEKFLWLVLEAVPTGPPVLAAGGINTGVQISALLCMFPGEMKKVLVEAGPDSTSRSPAYDLAFPPNVWLKGIEACCITEKTVADFEKGLRPENRKANMASGKEEYLLTYAGTGVQDLNKIESTSGVMQSLQNEIIAALKTRAPQLLGQP
ncbi:uncharacterized protein LAESUDRAFT_715766 [Laetiporus sulphureus 93-53]|uniref:Uncharacterized protein n=1 Tax=Laetiporus sulphureus 93-53 TaxID=1314785 RepID=A0A165D6E4_9APHY|nr:uncharacterized protein LAESUDRAFT_715766 [Laetiporus sulphureus 93-53]KZT04238.1 hypothetical protein LAESUDRAFT_715766 [Laetiporus sulphureus 93-53]